MDSPEIECLDGTRGVGLFAKNLLKEGIDVLLDAVRDCLRHHYCVEPQQWGPGYLSTKDGKSYEEHVFLVDDVLPNYRPIVDPTCSTVGFRVHLYNRAAPQTNAQVFFIGDAALECRLLHFATPVNYPRIISADLLCVLWKNEDLGALVDFIVGGTGGSQERRNAVRDELRFRGLLAAINEAPARQNLSEREKCFFIPMEKRQSILIDGQKVDVCMVVAKYFAPAFLRKLHKLRRDGRLLPSGVELKGFRVIGHNIMPAMEDDNIRATFSVNSIRQGLGCTRDWRDMNISRIKVPKKLFDLAPKAPSRRNADQQAGAGAGRG